MKITDILNSKPVTLSFEVFPPGSHAAFEATAAAASQIAALSPAFLSVTYGAGGGTSEYTLGLAEEIRAKNNVEVLPHLTCVSSDREHVNKMISAFQSKGFENIMALRGDLPKNVMLDYGVPIAQFTPSSGRLGYKFKGWYYDEDCTVQAALDEMPLAPDDFFKVLEQNFHGKALDLNKEVFMVGYRFIKEGGAK